MNNVITCVFFWFDLDVGTTTEWLGLCYLLNKEERPGNILENQSNIHHFVTVTTHS